MLLWSYRDSFLLSLYQIYNKRINRLDRAIGRVKALATPIKYPVYAHKDGNELRTNRQPISA